MKKSSTRTAMITVVILSTFTNTDYTDDYCPVRYYRVFINIIIIRPKNPICVMLNPSLCNERNDRMIHPGSTASAVAPGTHIWFLFIHDPPKQQEQ